MIKISIITPSKYIDKNVINSIDVVYSQKTNYELEHIIIVDEPDATAVNKKYTRDKYKLRVVINNGDYKGPSSARNIGITLSTGSHIFFLDADDIWGENHISGVMSIYTNNHNIDAISCAGKIIVDNEYKKTLTLPCIKDGLLSNNQILWNSIGCPSGFSFKKNSTQDRYFPKEINLCEDYLFYIGFIKNNSLIYRSNDNYFWYRLTTTQLSNIKDKKRYQNLIKYLEENEFNFKNKYQKILFKTQINRLAKRVCGLSATKETIVMFLISPSWVNASILKLFKNIYFRFQNLKFTI